MLTERQNLILENIVKDYINSAQPISSEFLQEKHNFGVSPATIRNEMQELEEKGYLLQPHTSAGRVPTDKAYRMFVDNLFEEDDIEESNFFDEFDQLHREMQNSFSFFQEMTKRLAGFSSSLALSYLPEEKVMFKEGWENVLNEPEFEDANFMKEFIGAVEGLEKNIDNLKFEKTNIKVYIGKENPTSKKKEFSVIVSQTNLPNGKKSKIVLVGPKRMEYERNIGLMSAMQKLFQ